MKKRMLALVMVGVMTIGFGTTAMAAAGEISTNDTTSTQSGEIWGSVSKTPLKQMKATVPIKIDFALIKGETDQTNKLVVSDLYAIKVPADSEVGIKLTNINVTQTNPSWSLGADSAVEADTTNVKYINLNVAGKELQHNTNAISDFKVGVAASKKLDITGHGSKAEITTNVASEKAFDIVYTIEQDTTTP